MFVPHPLRKINLSPRMHRQHCTDRAPSSPMAIAVRLRGALMDLGYRVLLMSPLHMLIAHPDRPNRFTGFHVDSAARLLERQYE